MLDGGATTGGEPSTVLDVTVDPPRVIRAGALADALVRVTGVIQAGGKSTRMGGQPKALLELGGRRIIERVLDVDRAPWWTMS